MVRTKCRRSQLCHVLSSSCRTLALFLPENRLTLLKMPHADPTAVPAKAPAKRFERCSSCNTPTLISARNCMQSGLRPSHGRLAPARCRSISSGARAFTSHPTPPGVRPFSEPPVSHARAGEPRFASLLGVGGGMVRYTEGRILGRNICDFDERLKRLRWS